jgi:SpoVK/Ycf46/Vps4 family AAA+-type ATPase
MSLSRGSCRLCRVETKRGGRRRSRRNDDPSQQQQQQQQRSWQQKLISSPQPTILLIQSNDNAIDNNGKDSTTSSMILCKCLPYSNDDYGSGGSSNEESTTPHSSNADADDSILAFDESVRIVLNNNNSCNNGKIEKMIRSYCDEDQTDSNDDDTNSNHEWWSLDEVDPEIVRRVCCYCSSSDDRRRRSHRPNSHRHAIINARISISKAGSNKKTDKESMHNTNVTGVTSTSSTFEDEDNILESPCLHRRRVVIPLFSPSVTVRPLQTLIISVTGSIPSLSVSPYQFTLSGKNNDDDFDHDNPLSTLLQACWKRQLVGKVIAMDDQWTCHIRLYVDGDDESSNTVYGMVESYKALTIPTSRSPAGYSRRYQKGKGLTESLSLPNDFYVVLPSTIITIQQNQPQTSTTGTTSGMDGPMTKSTPYPTNELPVISTASNTNDWNRESLRPPSAAAGLLVDTINCVRFGRGDVPRTFLLSGPPGCGKTFAATWAASVHPASTLLCSIRGSELLQVSTTSSNESSNNRNTPARALEWEFQKMVKMISLREQRNETEQIIESTTQSPSPLNKEKSDGVVGLIFLDECDALVSVDSVAAMLADLLDRVSSSSSSKKDQYWSRIMVVGATNRIDSIPSYLRRAGRFDREIPISPPSAKERAIFIASLLTKVQNSNSDDINITLPPISRLSTQKATTGTIVNKKENDKYEEDLKVGIPIEEIEEIAELCVGYVAADLSALVRKAWLLSLQEEGGGNIITYSHLEEARHIVGASALRDASLAAPPKITWDDISGDPGGAKTALRQAIEWPRLKAREFAFLGIQPCRGILLHGPPGCAKTTLARAAAGSSGVAFLSLSPAEVYASSYVGEAERIVRQAFILARSTSPCILFFDEIDSIFGGGGGSGGGGGGNGRGNSSEARVLSTFLNEMDGVDIAGAGKDGVLVLGATNRPWTLDAALMRP